MADFISTHHRAVIALLVLLTGLLGSLGLGYLTSRILKASNGRVFVLGYFALAILGVLVSIVIGVTISSPAT